MSTRLNKRLVELGLAHSRRGADQLIVAGSVKVNGQVVNQLGWVVEQNDIIQAQGRLAQLRPHITLALYKPRGYICSHVQQGKSPTIFALLPKSFAHLKIAGRLDRDSEGLTLLSSDGELVQQLTHPSHHKTKLYNVVLNRPVTPGDKAKLLKGVKLDDGVLGQFDSISSLGGNRYKVALHEGKYRHIRRAFGALNYGVLQLTRTQIGKLYVGDLAPGKYKIIQPSEVV